MNMMGKTRVAVIGSGIAGNAAAWALARRYDVTLFEKRDRPGGHSATVDIDYDGTPIAVDTGFIVYNEHNYPLLTRLFAELGVATEPSDMSFAVSAPAANLEWSGRSLPAIFAQKRNLVRPAFLWMLREILRFNTQARNDHADGALDGLSLGGYLDRHRFSRAMRRYYLQPMGAAIWSTPVDRILEFPAASFIAFLDNHKLLHADRPVWRTVSGGSRNYVSRLVAHLGERLHLGAPAERIVRRPGHVVVHLADGSAQAFTHVVLACHSDQTLALLGDPSDTERDILGSIGYRPNRVFLHRDARLMPRRRQVWSAWNYLEPAAARISNDDVTVSYWMNALQNIDRSKPLFVSLNPHRPPRRDLTFARFEYDHPQFDAAAIAAQRRLPSLQGVRNTWFCGAYHGHGFHEDGLRSGFAVAQQLNALTPHPQAQPISVPLAAAAD